MVFISTKTLKALFTKAVGTSEPVTLGPVQQQTAMKFHEAKDLPELANESTADEGSSSAHQQSCSSESEWEGDGELRARSGSSSASESPKATAWVPRRAALASETPEEKIQRAVRAVLNKLTIEKFEPLYEKLVSDCGLSEPEHMSIVMREIFEKATTQHHFIEMYADLCVRLESDPFLACARGSESERTSFKHLLLTECQRAFERLLNSDEQGKRDGEDQQELESLRRKRALGNVKLVGHLMVRGMLSSRLLVACCDALLRGEKSCKEALESLAALLTVTGKTFDGQKEWQYYGRLNAIFAKIEDFTKDKRVPARSRFLLRDLLDLRAAGWPAQGRPAVAKETPKTLEAIQAEWEAAQPSHSPTWFQTPSQLPASRPVASSTVPAPPAAKVSEKPAVSAKEDRPWHRARKAEAQAPEEAAQRALQEAMAKAAAIAEAQQARVQSAAAVPPQAPGEFSLKVFRKDLAATLKQLGLDRNVAAAVRRVRAHGVPEKHQAQEMTDLLTRAAEEPRGPVRRTTFAFACGLGAADPPAFSHSECLKGVKAFFEDVAGELVEEVPRLPQWISGELVPTLRSVFPEEDLTPVLPPEHR